MGYKGRVLFLTFSLVVSAVESFFKEITVSSFVAALLFAIIAYTFGWLFDRSAYFRKKAEISGRQFRDIIEFSPEPILIYQDTKIVFMNAKLAELMQLSSQQLMGETVFDFVLPEFHGLVKERIQKAYSGQKAVERMEIKVMAAENKILDIEVSSIPIIYENKPAIEVLIKDVTARKRLEEKSRKSEDLYRFITENSSDIITYLTQTGVYEYLSPSFNQVLGYTKNELVGQSLFQYLHPEEVDEIAQMFSETKFHMDFRSFSHRYKKKDGSFIWLETNAQAIRNDKNELVGVVAVSRDITERVNKEKKLLEKNQRLLHLAKTDSLSNIPNRRHFEGTLHAEWNRTMRHSLPLSALMIDIDHFKNFNDQYGHLAGDQCIREMAKAIKKTLKRPGDFVARYGGEEFVVLLPETDHNGARFMGESILEHVRALNIGIDDDITVSIGCATMVPTADINPEELIRMADNQLYLAKEAGRSQVK